MSMRMIARLALCLFLSTRCLRGAGLRENATSLSATEGIIISGGTGTWTSVEVFDQSTDLSCSLPNLPDDRSGHTMDSLLICGGRNENSSTTCLSFTSGQWITSHLMLEGRSDHTSWHRENGMVVIMGGNENPATSRTVGTFADGEHWAGGASFDLQYDTVESCSMPDLTSESVIITGGIYNKGRRNTSVSSTVSRYTMFGWTDDLPSLVVGRSGHGCGSFFRGDGTQVLLVAGGFSRDVNKQNSYLSSTEVLTMDSPGWTLTTPLPRAVDGLRGVTVGGKLFMTGGLDDDWNERDEVMVWLDEEQEWENTGKMKVGRAYHAVSTIQMDGQAVEKCV